MLPLSVSRSITYAHTLSVTACVFVSDKKFCFHSLQLLRVTLAMRYYSQYSQLKQHNKRLCHTLVQYIHPYIL